MTPFVAGFAVGLFAGAVGCAAFVVRVIRQTIR